MAAAPSTAATKLLIAMGWNGDVAPQDERQRMVYGMLKLAESSVISAKTSEATALENFILEVQAEAPDPQLEEEIRQTLQEVKDVV